jgi:hypothetical protein
MLISATIAGNYITTKNIRTRFFISKKEGQDDSGNFGIRQRDDALVSHQRGLLQANPETATPVLSGEVRSRRD